jgi:hypothetical protein
MSDIGNNAFSLVPVRIFRVLEAINTFRNGCPVTRGQAMNLIVEPSAFN